MGASRGYFIQLAETPIRDRLDGDGNGLNNIENHTFGLFETLGPHPMGPIQHDTVGQHDRRQLLDVVGKAIVASPDDRQCLGSLAQR